MKWTNQQFNKPKTPKNQIFGLEDWTSKLKKNTLKYQMINRKMSTTQNLFGFEQIGVNDKANTALIFEEINKELEEYLLEKSNDTDSTDSVFDFLVV